MNSKTSGVENQLSETQNVLARLEEAGNMGYFIADIENENNNIMSDAAYKMLGCEPGSFVPTGEKFVTFLHPDDIHKLAECREEMAEKGCADKEFRVKREDTGEWFWMLVRTTFFERNKDGAPIKTIGIHQDITRFKKVEEEIKTLRGIIPICSYCKKIKDDKGYWNQVEAYVSAHSKAEFSHSYCPECVKEHYPEMYKKLFNPTDGTSLT